MTPKTCPRCGQPATGNFCATCGAVIAARACPTCGAAPEPGSRFCTRCGSPLAPGAHQPASGQGVGAGGAGGIATDRGPDANLGWWVAGGLMVVLILVIGWPILNSGPATPAGGVAPAAGTAGGVGPATGPSSVDLSSMTPREAADRLYNRVVGTAEAGDSATAISFTPMAIAAFEQARPLDPDGLFHLSEVHRIAGDQASVLSTAEEALAEAPDHLLNLYAAGGAAAAMGDTARALDHYRRLLDAWDAEMASGNLDYEAHANAMAEMRAAARAFVAANGG